MKIKDMIKKIEDYNEIAEIVGGAKMELHFRDQMGCGYQKVMSYKQFSGFICREYLDSVAKAILNGDYEFDKASKFIVQDHTGFTFDVAVAFEIYSA